MVLPRVLSYIVAASVFQRDNTRLLHSVSSRSIPFPHKMNQLPLLEDSPERYLNSSKDENAYQVHCVLECHVLIACSVLCLRGLFSQLPGLLPCGPPLTVILSDIRAKLDLIRTKVAVIPSTPLWLLPYGSPPR